VTDADPRDLYGLPLDRFVSERGVLAKALRAEGDKEEAALVAALRKPSVAAWTVNQLIRTQRRAVEAVFEAGDEVKRAQSELLAGQGSARVLREAAGRERRAVDEVTEVARGFLSSEGHEPTPATLDRVSMTLHAAALDEEARGQVREACLEHELRQVGFGVSEDVGPPAMQQAERQRAERLKSARKAEAAARREAERAARDVDGAQERRDRAAGSLQEAEDALASARERAEDATLAHQRAQRAMKGV
jgi:hypothetical protein